MQPFNFFFSFYGLLLGLSAGTVIVRFADAIGEHRARLIGVLAPLLGFFVLLDITAVWIWAWRARAAFQITYEYMYFGLAIASAYFFSASQVFPKDSRDWKSLDEHYWARKRYVVPGIAFANAAILAHGVLVRGSDLDRSFWLQQPFYWVPLIALMFTRKKWVDITLLAVLCLHYAIEAVLLRM